MRSRTLALARARVKAFALPTGLKPSSPPVARASPIDGATGLRDLLLVLASAAYALGYLSWAFFAWAYGLGPVPVLYADYVMTGLFPLLLLAISVRLAKTLKHASVWTRGAPSPRQMRLGKFVTSLGGTGIALTIPLKFIASDGVYMAAGMLSMAALLAGAIMSRGKGDRFLKRLAGGFVWYTMIVGTFIGLVAYWQWVFAAWPQQLGGPRPRCAMFDADAAQLAPETRTLLFGSSPDTTGKHRTVSLYTIFAGGDFVLVKRDSTPLHRREPVYRLPKAALGAELPCGAER